MGNNDSGVVMIREATLAKLLDDLQSLRRDMDLMVEATREQGAQNGMLKSVLTYVTRDANRLRSELRGGTSAPYRPRGGVVSAAQQLARMDREEATRARARSRAR